VGGQSIVYVHNIDGWLEICLPGKGPFILLCPIISVEFPTNFYLPFMLIGCLGLPLF